MTNVYTKFYSDGSHLTVKLGMTQIRMQICHIYRSQYYEVMVYSMCIFINYQLNIKMCMNSKLVVD